MVFRCLGIASAAAEQWLGHEGKGNPSALPHTSPSTLPPPRHITCWKLASVYFLRVTCPWKINRYLFRKLSKAFRNLTLVERERMLLNTFSTQVWCSNCCSQLLGGEEGTVSWASSSGCPLHLYSFHNLAKQNRHVLAAESGTVCDVILHMQERCFFAYIWYTNEEWSLWSFFQKSVAVK